MAKKKTESKIIIERTYVIPLSRETRKAPYYRKSKKAMSLIKKFIAKHMKSETISIGHYLNTKVWQHGIKNPPSKVKVTVSKEESGKVLVELFGAPKTAEKKSEKETKKGGEIKEGKESSDGQKTKNAKIIDTKAEKIEEEIELKKEENAETAKKIEKEEIKEMQHEHQKKHAPKTTQEPKSQEGHPPAPKHL